MSEWGFTSPDSARRRMKADNEEFSLKISDMSRTVLEQDKEIRELKDRALTRQTELGKARAAEAHMRGYIERVKEIDRQSSPNGDG